MRIFSFLGLLVAALVIIFSLASIATGSLVLLLAVGVVLLAVGAVTGM